MHPLLLIVGNPILLQGIATPYKTIGRFRRTFDKLEDWAKTSKVNFQEYDILLGSSLINTLIREPPRRRPYKSIQV